MDSLFDNFLKVDRQVVYLIQKVKNFIFKIIVDYTTEQNFTSSLSNTDIMQNLKPVKQQSYRLVLEGPINGTKKTVQVFSKLMVQNHNFEETLMFNKFIFTNTSTKAFPKNLLPINFEQDESMYLFIQDYYQQTLHDYLKKQKISEKEALKIFQQVLKAIYSLTFESLPHRSIRPQQFVFINGEWKLRAAVWSKQNYGINNEFTLNPAYQAPEEYNDSQSGDLDDCQIMVWCLGSLLLDLLMGSHLLSDAKIINKFKNKEFSLQALGSKKEISQQILDYLSLMLHYNPEKRTQLNVIYADGFFSKDISIHYKKNSSKVGEGKSDLRESLKESVTLARSGKGNQNKLLKCQSRGLLNGASNDLLQSSLKMLEIDANVSRQQLLMSKKGVSSEIPQMIKQEKDFFNSLALKTKVIKRREEETEGSPLTIENDQDLRNIFSIYKTFIDRSELLCISVKKFSQIPYDDKYREEFILLNEFSVYYVSLIQLHKILQSLNKNHNIYKIPDSKFDAFIKSSNFIAYRQQANDLFMSKKQTFEYISTTLLNLPQSKRKLMKNNRFVAYVQKRNIYEHSFSNIKLPYREILKMTYDKISVLYNNRREENLCRLSLYTVYCMTIDKLYIEEDLKDNFASFIQWNSLNSTRRLKVDHKEFFTLSVSELQRYFDTAPLATLISHSKMILTKYYRV